MQGTVPVHIVIARDNHDPAPVPSQELISQSHQEIEGICVLSSEDLGVISQASRCATDEVAANDDGIDRTA